jgi:hypothetical protein
VPRIGKIFEEIMAENKVTDPKNRLFKRHSLQIN